MNEQRSNIKKACRTLFPMGFGVRKVEDRVIILEFLDTGYNEGDDAEIIASIAMTEEKAGHFIESLKKAVNGDEDDSE